MKFVYIVIGVLIGWLTVGMLLAGSSGAAFWTSWQQAKILTLLEQIEVNTR